MSALDFSHDDVERAARYHRPRYVALAIDLVLSVAVLAVLQWAWLGPWHLVDGLGWAGAAAAYAGIVTAIGALVGAPVSFWRGYLQERQWGFSTQSAADWLVDQLKGEAVGLLLLAAPLDGARRSRPVAALGLAGSRRRCARARRRVPLVRCAGCAGADLQPLPAAR